MNADWLRLCSLHISEDGQIAAVWVAWDKDTDSMRVYDCIPSQMKVLAIHADAIKKRGKWIPTVWNLEGKEIANMLLEHDCKILPETLMKKDTDMIAESLSQDIWQRMETGRFKVADHIEDWWQEFEEFSREEMKIPKDYPLMNATRHAIPHLRLGKSYKSHLDRKYKANYPEISIA